MSGNHEAQDLHKIEFILNEHPDVDQALVVSVPTPSEGEKLVAWVVKDINSELSTQELVNFLEDKSDNQVPDHIELTDEFPMTPSGKVQKLKLIELSKDLV
ncbi:AMP-binding enzyme [Aquisalibacillus elongatus]|uniref:AMP-binding enzyme n=1 Tax=Aquisalibacillus elongatus TaxID=485577 RepID=UPI001474061C|nr:class I adenylate-forming enzyme family protein [Aquisalibacillus elongatus]